MVLAVDSFDCVHCSFCEEWRRKTYYRDNLLEYKRYQEWILFHMHALCLFVKIDQMELFKEELNGSDSI